MMCSQENLYEEDVKDKARAANCIATLFRQAQHLEPLLSHATLLPTLARVLRDDGKRSVDLCVGIQSVWLVLSNFSQFHQLLVENQVGVLTIEVLDLEIKRTEHRVKVCCLCLYLSLATHLFTKSATYTPTCVQATLTQTRCIGQGTICFSVPAAVLYFVTWFSRMSSTKGCERTKGVYDQESYVHGRWESGQ